MLSGRWARERQQALRRGGRRCALQLGGVAGWPEEGPRVVNCGRCSFLKKVLRVKEGALGSCSSAKADTLLLLDCPSPRLARELFSLWQVGGHDALSAPGVLETSQPWARELGTHVRMARFWTAAGPGGGERGMGRGEGAGPGRCELLSCRPRSRAWLGRGPRRLCFSEGFLPQGVGGLWAPPGAGKAPRPQGKFLGPGASWSSLGEGRGVSISRGALPRLGEGDGRRLRREGRVMVWLVPSAREEEWEGVERDGEQQGPARLPVGVWLVTFWRNGFRVTAICRGLSSETSSAGNVRSPLSPRMREVHPARFQAA